MAPDSKSLCSCSGPTSDGRSVHEESKPKMDNFVIFLSKLIAQSPGASTWPVFLSPAGGTLGGAPVPGRPELIEKLISILAY